MKLIINTVFLFSNIYVFSQNIIFSPLLKNKHNENSLIVSNLMFNRDSSKIFYLEANVKDISNGKLNSLNLFDYSKDDSIVNIKGIVNLFFNSSTNTNFNLFNSLNYTDNSNLISYDTDKKAIAEVNNLDSIVKKHELDIQQVCFKELDNKVICLSYKDSYLRCFFNNFKDTFSINCFNPIKAIAIDNSCEIGYVLSLNKGLLNLLKIDLNKKKILKNMTIFKSSSIQQAGITIIKNDSLAYWHNDSINGTKITVGNVYSGNTQSFHLEGEVKDLLSYRNKLYINLLYKTSEFYDFPLLKDSNILISTKIAFTSNILKIDLNAKLQQLDDEMNCLHRPITLMGSSDYTGTLNVRKNKKCGDTYLKVLFSSNKNKSRCLITNTKGERLFDSRKKTSKTNSKVLLTDDMSTLNIDVTNKSKKDKWTASYIFE